MAFTKSLHLLRRADIPSLSNTMTTMLIVLVALLIVVVVLIGALLFLRHRRKVQKAARMPVYNDHRLSTSSVQSFHRRVMARPSQSVLVLQERALLDDPSTAPPPSALPEIRITFPEEVDSAGKRQSGRVVVVHVGDTSTGMEPVTEKLPSYQQSGGRFDEVDLERVGGLMEKEIR